jgi:pimeloyl-ACP methyl ester carboxylesterase
VQPEFSNPQRATAIVAEPRGLPAVSSYLRLGALRATMKGNDMTTKQRNIRAIRLPLIATAITIGSVGFLPNIVAAQAAPATTSKPTVVLVHGAWADASSWNGVIPILEHEGYTVDAPPNPLRGLTSDSAYIASFLKSLTGPIVLVGHSYGGGVITNAATGNPNVKALVYIDAFEPAQGEKLGVLLDAQPGSCISGDGNLSDVFNYAVDPGQPANDPDLYLKTAPGPNYAGFDACFANGVSTSQAAVLAAEQRPLAAGAVSEESGVPAWLTIPSWSQIGSQDHVIPPAELEFMSQRAHSTIQVVDAGHLSMISKPDQTASLIVRAATATS